MRVSTTTLAPLPPFSSSFLPSPQGEGFMEHALVSASHYGTPREPVKMALALPFLFLSPPSFFPFPSRSGQNFL